MQTLILIIGICCLVACGYWTILYIDLSSNHLKNIFNKLSQNSLINPKWFLPVSLATYPSDVITRLQFINRLMVYVLLRNMKKKKNQESYQIVISTLSSEEIKLLARQGIATFLIFLFFLFGITLSWL